MSSHKTELTGRAKEVFDFIVLHKTENDGQSPTMREIMQNTDITSTSVVRYYLDKLKDFGYISRNQGEARGIWVVGGAWTYSKSETGLSENDSVL